MPQISQQELETYLWDAANIIRGRMDAADFKTYIFPLLFLKRICDVHDEEFNEALGAYDGNISAIRLLDGPVPAWAVES